MILAFSISLFIMGVKEQNQYFAVYDSALNPQVQVIEKSCQILCNSGNYVQEAKLTDSLKNRAGVERLIAVEASSLKDDARATNTSYTVPNVKKQLPYTIHPTSVNMTCHRDSLVSIYIMSSGSASTQRQTIRNTWGSKKLSGFTQTNVFFVVYLFYESKRGIGECMLLKNNFLKKKSSVTFWELSAAHN